MGRKSKGIAGDPAKVAAAQATVFEALGVSPTSTTPKASYRIGCFYGACERTFDPKGSGSVIHGTCIGAAPAFSAYRKADEAGKAAMAEAARKLVAAK